MPRDPETYAHLEWLGYVQPVGLVVSVPALLQAQAYINRNIAPEQQVFLSMLPRDKRDQPIPEITDFPTFTRRVLGWEPGDLVDLSSDEAAGASLEVAVPEYGETLRPTYAVRELPVPETLTRSASKEQVADNQKLATAPWLLLIQVLPTAIDLNEVGDIDHRHWQASPQARFERLLRETQVPTGLLVNGTHMRLVYAPRGESSGHITFPVAAMAQVAGRPIFAALVMLLSAERLFTVAEKQRLPAILTDSRKYQNVVSTKLAEQVLAALYELVRGFQAADDQARGKLLAEVLREDPNHVYAGLLTVLMRLVFVLYAEDRGLLSADSVFANFYSVTGLFDRLRADNGRFPDTMDQRYGAWSQLLTLFRLVYDGGGHGPLQIPGRKGYLFDPDRYPFLERRPWKSHRRDHVDRLNVPRVSDGVIFRVLANLLVLDGERLSYRTLDVEQIGSVYETIMGFNLDVAHGRSIAIKPVKPHGAPATINLDELLAAKSAERAKWLADQSDQKLTGQAVEALKRAESIDDLLAALERKIAWHATPHAVPKGAMVLQPSDERRRSGSHYTPRSLTEPIVRTTLHPILEQLGERPTAEQILNLKICDPAMGSAAFLVEACRQLGDELVKSWHVHSQVPKLPPDEDEILHARRLVAQRCLYGVDRNPMAVDLAKLSLWLATLAKDHPFTFLDHSLRYGDSLVGLTRKQIAGFHWAPTAQMHLLEADLKQQIEIATGARREILQGRDDVAYELHERALSVADEALDRVRLVGDAVIAAWFGAAKDKDREKLRQEYLTLVEQACGPMKDVHELRRWLEIVRDLRNAAKPIVPFHWEIEFPEVFAPSSPGTSNSQPPTAPGFDAIVGNPPFMGGSRISGSSGEAYRDWLLRLHDGSHGNGDLVAHFFRRAFDVLRSGGTFGLIATKTIGQGDTRATGLRWICKHGGTIYAARKRYKWPGQAAVIVSIVHIAKGPVIALRRLDGREVPTITAYLFHAGGHDDAQPLLENKGRSSKGFDICGLGFIFDDDAAEGESSSLAEMRRVIAQTPRNTERIFPYVGGEEILNLPSLSFRRYVINFGEMDESEARAWPDLMAIVEAKVRPQRLKNNRTSYRDNWWKYAERRPGMQAVISGLERILVTARVGNAFAFGFISSRWIMNEKVVVFAFDAIHFFCAMQSRVHEVWARFFSATLKDDLQYALSDCFETFPFPSGYEANPKLERCGRDYYDFRAALMVRNDEGLTKTYNRFHDPAETSADIARLRELHAAMDAAVLEAYGWSDLAQTARCEFLLDYEDEDDDEEPDSRRSSRGRRKPWRHRWPDEFHDDVLARLLALNAQRAEEERLLGQAVAAQEKATAGGGKLRKRATKRPPRTAHGDKSMFD